MTVGRIACGAAEPDTLRLLAERLPRPIRFLGVGGLGLLTDIGVFTLILMHWPHPLLARVLSIAAATVVTWRLNRALTFERGGRRQTHEALRYAAVTATAQSISYAVFAVLTFKHFAGLPQVALLIGAAAGTLISYNGHRLFAFAPRPGAVRQS
jgi:putative flippase GtrA